MLFPTTIRNNIATGKQNATMDEIIAAAQLANAHDFISSFPEGYDTIVGDQGAQLSGGQRQRIAIARALIKNPNVLLLDEATSALDNESEAVVQEALDRAGSMRTTIVIAHRLSTIVHADLILVLDSGRIIEQGRHEDLLAKKGMYYNMVERQHLATSGAIKQRRASMRTSTTVDSTAVSPTYGISIPETVEDSARNFLADHDLQLSRPGHSEVKQDEKPAPGQAKTGMMDDPKEQERREKELADQEISEEAKHTSLIKWVFFRNRPEWLILLVGVIMSAAEGLVWPVFSIVLSEIMSILINGDSASDISKYALAFVGIGGGMILIMSLKFTCLAIAGEQLTLRLRVDTFAKMLSMPVAWFDMPQHTKAVLGSRLANDANDVKGVLSSRLGLLLQLLTTLFGGIGIALFFCWRVALVVLGTTPVVAAAGALQLKVMTGFSQTKAYEKSSHYASTAIDNIRTVIALGRIQGFLDEYMDALRAPASKIKRIALVQGCTFGVTEFSLFAVWALAFWYGSIEVSNGDCSFADMMKAISGILFGAMMSGQIQV